MIAINAAVLDWTMCQPIPIVMPKDATILCVQYHSQHDHIYFSANPNGEKVVREFVVGHTNSVFEDLPNRSHVYIGTTIDEDNNAWHIYELVKQEAKAPVTKPPSSVNASRPTSPPPPRKK